MVDRPPGSIRNQRSPEGEQLGEMMARFCDEAEPAARLKEPALPPRCNSCAFRKGPHLANGSPATQMDVIKCLIEGHQFDCHEPAREGSPCSGWAMMMLAQSDVGEFGKVPWDFTNEVKG